MEDLIEPIKNGWIIYTKSNCKYCNLAKELFHEENINIQIINCDNWLIELNKKEYFLNKIKEYVGKEYKTFPMIFKDGQFIGGFKETEQYINKNKIEFNILNDF